MLKELLSTSDCAKCRKCCEFDRYDIWETPVITPQTYEKIVKNVDFDISLIYRNGCYILRPPYEMAGDEVFVCPLLDTENGCRLGDDKPFDCQIWPFRIMQIGGRRAITISPFCEKILSKSLDEIIKFVKNSLAKEIFNYADRFPQIVKPYDDMYPVLAFEPISIEDDCED